MLDLVQNKLVADIIVQEILSSPGFIVPITEPMGRLVGRAVEECSLWHIKEALTKTAGTNLSAECLRQGRQRCCLIQSRWKGIILTVVTAAARPAAAVARNGHHRDVIWFQIWRLTSLPNTEAAAFSNCLIHAATELSFFKCVVHRHGTGQSIFLYRHGLLQLLFVRQVKAITMMTGQAELWKWQGVSKYSWNHRCLSVPIQSVSSTFYRLFRWWVTQTEFRKALRCGCSIY